MELNKIYGKGTIGGLRHKYDQQQSIARGNYENIEDYEKGFLAYLNENGIKLPVE